MQTYDQSPLVIAQALTAPGKGILASDESPSTIGRRLERAGVVNTEDNRRKYRELFYTAPIGEAGISGAILFPEALNQKSDDGTSFVRCLYDRGVIPGVKVDEGLRPLCPTASGAAEGETDTKGLEGLLERCKGYFDQGARFAKWRAALRVGGDGRSLPSEVALERNAAQLAEYAEICLAAGLVPIVEPEVLIDGGHDAAASEAATTRAIAACVAHLWRRNIALEAVLLKPQMVIAGADWTGPKYETVADATLRALRRTVPPAIPGVMFLSGGQSEEEATRNLNAINVAAKASGGAPWALSFSFGRALQASVLSLWTEGKGSKDQCRELAAKIAHANGQATLGVFGGPHPSLRSSGESLQETFRGWRP